MLLVIGRIKHVQSHIKFRAKIIKA